MNQEAQELMAQIVAKEVFELTDNDVAFLKARQGYLTDEQTEKFASVLGEAEEAPKPTKKKKG